VTQLDAGKNNMQVESNALPVNEGDAVEPQMSFTVDEPSTCDVLTKKVDYFMQISQTSTFKST